MAEARPKTLIWKHQSIFFAFKLDQMYSTLLVNFIPENSNSPTHRTSCSKMQMETLLDYKTVIVRVI